MSADGYEIRAYAEADREEILELQTHHWGDDPERNAAYLRWKYYENPYVDEPCITLALHRGRVVGMRGMYGARWRVGEDGETFDAPCAGDVVIDPDHRQRRLFDRMMAAAEAELARRGYGLAFNTSASAITYVSSLRLGWKGIGPLGMVAREPGFRSRLAARLGWRGPRFDAEQPRPKAMADLVVRACRDARIRHERDPSYLEWRFRNPFARYAFLFERDDSDALAGFLVLQRPARDRTRWRIVDAEAIEDAVHSRLLARALACGRGARVETWSAGAPASRRDELEARGFRHRKEAGFLGRARPTVLVRRLATPDASLPEALRHDALLDGRRWDMRMLFSDAY